MKSSQPHDRRDSHADRRAYPRFSVDMPAHLSVNGKSAPCQLVDV